MSDSDFDLWMLDFLTSIPDASGLTATWTATGTPGLAQICDEFGSCREEAFDLRVAVRLVDDAGSWPAVFVMGGFGSSPTTVERSLYPLGGQEVWDALRDGVVDIRFEPLAPPTAPNETATVLIPASMSAEVIWTANTGPVPVRSVPWGVVKSAYE